MKVYDNLNFRHAEYHDPNLHYSKKKTRLNRNNLSGNVFFSHNVSEQMASNSASNVPADYLKINWRDAGQLLTFGVLLASIVPVSGVDTTPGGASAAVPAIRDAILQREEANNKIAQMKHCKRILDRIIRDCEGVIYSQSYMSVICERVFDNIRIVNRRFNLLLQTYGDQSCLLDCDDSMLKIADNMRLLTEKINHLASMRIELDHSPVTPDDNQIRERIREQQRLVQAVMTENAVLNRLCANNKAQAERIRTYARFNKNNFIFNCDGVFSTDVTIPDFDDHPVDTAFYNVRNHVNRLRKVRGEAEVEIVQAENQRGKLRMVVSPRLG